ncbi:hypothetical protein BDQ17DRAFT_1428688 [Cyathus striatus]|nr:hypothetical protein BDQ17DRAFT_1428688 [Cyathus striatus]
MSHPLLSPPITPTNETDCRYLPPIFIYRTPSPAPTQTPRYHTLLCSPSVAAPEPQDPTHSQPFSPLTPSSEDDRAASKLAKFTLSDWIAYITSLPDSPPSYCPAGRPWKETTLKGKIADTWDFFINNVSNNNLPEQVANTADTSDTHPWKKM